MLRSSNPVVPVSQEKEQLQVSGCTDLAAPLSSRSDFASGAMPALGEPPVVRNSMQNQLRKRLTCLMT
eukprot:5309866-Amphidinium_carterae.1